MRVRLRALGELDHNLVFVAGERRLDVGFAKEAFVGAGAPGRIGKVAKGAFPF